MRALIVGAGPGGLAAAINLAGLGLEVTVVEKEPIPGGRMRGLTFVTGAAISDSPWSDDTRTVRRRGAAYTGVR